MKTLLLAATLAVGVATQAHAYTYVPTEQDKHEMNRCILAKGAGAKIADCLTPVASRIMNDYAKNPAQRGQLQEMTLHAAAMVCHMSADPPPPAEQACMRAEVQKIVNAVVIALRDYVVNAR